MQVKAGVKKAYQVAVGGVGGQDQAAQVDGVQGLVVSEPLIYISDAEGGTWLDDDGPNRVIAVLLLNDVHPGLLAGTSWTFTLGEPPGARRLSHRKIVVGVLEGRANDQLLELAVVGPPGIVVGGEATTKASVRPNIGVGSRIRNKGSRLGIAGNQVAGGTKPHPALARRVVRPVPGPLGVAALVVALEPSAFQHDSGTQDQGHDVTRTLEHAGQVGDTGHGPAREVQLHHVLGALEHALEGLGRGHVPLGHLVDFGQVDRIVEEVAEVRDLTGIPSIDGRLGNEETVILKEVTQVGDLRHIPLVQAIGMTQLGAVLEEAGQGGLAALVGNMGEVQARAIEGAQHGEALEPALGIGGLEAIACIALKDDPEDLSLVSRNHVGPRQKLGVVTIVHAGQLSDHPGLVSGVRVHRDAHGQDSLDLVELPPGVVVGDEAAGLHATGPGVGDLIQRGIGGGIATGQVLGGAKPGLALREPGTVGCAMAVEAGIEAGSTVQDDTPAQGQGGQRGATLEHSITG